MQSITARLLFQIHSHNIKTIILDGMRYSCYKIMYVSHIFK